MINDALPVEPAPADGPQRPKQRITPRALLEVKRLSEPQIHPDGVRVAFVVTEADFDESEWISHLWITELVSPETTELEPDSVEVIESDVDDVVVSGTVTDEMDSGVESDETEAADEAEQDFTRQLTFSREGESFPRWSPDGRFLAFLSSRPDPTEEASSDEDDEEQEQVWALPIDGGEARRLTGVKEGVIDYAWTPDSTSIIFLSPEARAKPVESVRKEERDRRKIDPIVEQDDRLRRQFWRVEVEARKPKLLFTADYGISEFALSPDGEQICYATNYTGIQNDYHLVDLFVRKLEGGPAVKLIERPGGKYQPCWSPDGTRIAFLSWFDPQLSYSRETVYIAPVPSPNLKTEEIDTQVHVADSIATSSSSGPGSSILETATLEPATEASFDFDIGAFDWSKHNGCLYALAHVRTGSEIIRIDPNTRAVSRLDLSSTEDRADMALDLDGSRIVWVQQNAGNLPEIFLRDENGETHQLTKLNTDFSNEYRLPRQEVVQWIGLDGLEIEGVLTYPLDYRAGERYPLIVQIHGGPKGRITDTLLSYTMPPVWSAEGYAVLRPNFRGSEGYGHAFAIANRRDLGGGDYQDIMAGVDWAIKQGVADPQRLGVMGGSYGGYMTNWIVGHTERFAAAVSMFGIFYLQTDYSNSELSRWDNDYLGAYYWEDPEIYRRLSPGSYVEHIKTPTLILHGDDDDNTFISNSKEMYQALLHRGVTTQFVHYPREGHGLREPNHKLDEIRRCLAWMDRYVRHGGRAPGVYRVGDRIPDVAGRLELCVTKAEIAVFVGQPRPSEQTSGADIGALLEVNLAIHNPDTRQTIAPLTMDLNSIRLEIQEQVAEQEESVDHVNSEAVSGTASGARSDSEPLLPVGVPLEIHGTKVLIEGDNLHLSQHPDPESGYLAFAVGVVFRVPVSGGEALLRVADFPPIKVSWTAEDEEIAEKRADKEGERSSM